MLENVNSYTTNAETTDHKDIENDLINIAYLNNRFGWVGVVLLWLVYLFLFRYSSGVILFVWSGAIFVGVIAHLYVMYQHSTKIERGDPLARSTRKMVLLSAYHALILGCSPLFFLDLNNLATTYLITVLVACPLFGSAVVVATMKKAHLVYVFLSAQPLIFLLLFSSVTELWLMGLLLQFAAIPASVLLNSYFNSMIKRSIILKYENRALLDIVHQQKVVAEEANQYKTRLLATTSHDLRQPLSALNLYLEALATMEKSTQQDELISKSKALSQALGSLIGTLVDRSRLDTSDLEIRVESFSLQKLLQNLVDEFQLIAQRKGMFVKFKKINFKVESDVVLLTAILRNLVSNAVIHNDQGDVKITVQDIGKKVCVKIIDHGKGFSSVEYQNIFHEYYQLENPDRDRNIGLGLGLTIVKRAADLLGYEINVESAEGKGSVFSLQIPKTMNVESESVHLSQS